MNSMSEKTSLRVKIVSIIILAVVSGLISYPKAVSFSPKVHDFFNRSNVNLGLDLQGGIHLEYRADISGIDSDKIGNALESVQDVIERRINAFGVGEPLVQTSRSGGEYRVIVELPGIKDVDQAKQRIGEAPDLQFKEQSEPDDQVKTMFENLNTQNKAKAEDVLRKVLNGENFEELAKANSQDPGSKDNGGDLGFVKKGTFVPEFDKVLFEGLLKPGEIYFDLVETQFGWHIIKFIESKGEGEEKEVHAQHILFGKQDSSQYPELTYKATGLTGKNLKDVQVVFEQQGIGKPQISLEFDEEGTKLFAEVTKRNVGKPLAIVLDGQIKTAPNVQTEITDGKAVINGSFSIDEANKLQRMINEGALPIPLTLVNQQSVEASLGQASLQKSLYAGMIGIIAVVVFMIFYYRLLGLIASLALLIYAGIMVAFIKLTGITLTLSGIAGFILSIGMAVDANILIFERTKEEIRRGRSMLGAIDEGFKRAWTSIRDGNVSSIITAIILLIMGTGFVKGFALTLLLGVAVSMFTAIVISRTLLKFIVGTWVENKLWLIGVKKPKEVRE